jgi:hypothetical protein
MEHERLSRPFMKRYTRSVIGFLSLLIRGILISAPSRTMVAEPMIIVSRTYRVLYNRIEKFVSTESANCGLSLSVGLGLLTPK